MNMTVYDFVIRIIFSDLIIWCHAWKLPLCVVGYAHSARPESFVFEASQHIMTRVRVPLGPTIRHLQHLLPVPGMTPSTLPILSLADARTLMV